MDFAILGPLVVHVDGRSLDLGGRKQRAVLAMLLLDANRVVALDHLIDRLWGEEPPPTATTALHVYVSHLRRLLEPARRAGSAWTVLVTEAPGYKLVVDEAHLDSACFEAEVGTGLRLLASGRPQEASGMLRQALGRWRGPVLADFQGEAFTMTEAARLDELRLQAIEERLAADLASGAHRDVVGELEAHVAAFPYRERLWGLLMVALYRSQRQADALRAFTRARSVLSEELGLEPGPALRRLENDILAHSPTLEWQPPAAEPARSVGPVVSRAHDPGASTEGGPQAFVGRRRELAALEAAVGEISGGSARTVLVSGEPGIGKTRLVDELVRIVTSSAGPMVAWGHCPEGEGAPPYWPWATVLEELVVAGGEAAIAALRPVAGEISQIVPGVKELVTDLKPPPAVDGATARFHLHRAVATLLADLAAARSVLIVLDDLHWADPASLELLRVVTTDVTSGVAVVATYRDVDAGPQNMADLLGSLARNSRFVRIRLRGFESDEVRRLVAQAGGAAPSAGAVDALRARTDGNPFFVLELAKLLASEHRWDAPAAVMEAAIPDAVSDVIMRRLARLPKDTRELLEVAAVAGRDFDVGVVAAAVTTDEEEAVETLDVALASGLLVDDRDDPRRYRFSHALIQETIEGRLSAMRHARLHARVGEVISQRPDADARVGELAHHFTQAAALTGIPRAVRYLIAAGRSAQAALGFEDAEQLFRRAIALAGKLPEAPEQFQLALDAQVALAAFLTFVSGFTVPATARAWEEADRLAAKAEDPAAVADASWGRMMPPLSRGDTTVVAALGQRLLQLAAATGDISCQVIGHWGVGMAACLQGDLATSESQLAAALDRSDNVEPGHLRGFFGPPVAAVFLPQMAAMVVALRGDVAAGSALYGRAVENARHVSRTALVAALLGAALVGFVDRSPEIVSTASCEATAIAERGGMPDYGALGRILRGWAAAQLGAPEAGLADIESGIESHQRSGFRLFRTANLAAQAETLGMLGRSEDALGTIEAAFTEMEETGERFYEGELHRLKAELLIAAHPDRRVDAMGSLQRAVDVASAQGALTFLRRAQASLDAASGLST